MNNLYVTHCPCDGMQLDSRMPYHFVEPCTCKSCETQPNYCEFDGAYIGTREYREIHQEEQHS